ncbi:NAD-P-binding protein [Pilatotrama ljubarskyi]|nr:NAD-P-binding protein [Pilatotrama ljubarskyi]
MANDKPLVLVLGATGFTGGSIVRGLLESGNFRVAALVRPASVNKAAAQEFRASGVEIRTGDVTNGVAQQKEALAGVDILISAVDGYLVAAQENILRAAKEVGIKRVVPCDFATPGEKGVRDLHDQKLAIRDLIKDLGLPYTFIDVGWWMQLALPLPTRSKVPEAFKQLTYELHGSGTQKMLLTDYRDIGAYVARTVADPRTLNQAVIIWEEELPEEKVHEIGEHFSGEADNLKAKRTYVSAEEMKKRIAEGKAEVAKDPTNILAHFKIHGNGYMYSIHILGENTLESAKRLGYLDARELYPDGPKRSLEEFAKEYYSREEPGLEYLRGN